MSAILQSKKTKTSKSRPAIEASSTSSTEKENASRQEISQVKKLSKEKITAPSLPSRKILRELNTAQVQARDAFYGRQENQGDASTASTQRTRIQPRRQTRSSILISDIPQPSIVGATNAAERGRSANADERENVPVASSKRSAVRSEALTPSADRASSDAATTLGDGRISQLKLHQSVAIDRGLRKGLHSSSIVKSSLNSSGLLHFKLI